MTGLKALTCPNCGGAVEISDAQAAVIKCNYCGTALQLPEAEDPPSPPPPDPVVERPYTPYIPYRPLKPAARGGIAFFSIFFTLIAIAGIGLGIYAAIDPGLGGVFDTIYPVGKLVPVTLADGAAPDLAVLVRVGEEDDNRLALLDGVTHKLRWKTSQTFKSGGGQRLPVAGSERIYFLDEKNNLQAFNLSDGTLAWQAQTKTGVDFSCAGCLRLVGEQLLALNKDGTLEAYAAASGKLNWSKSLNSTPRQLDLAAGQLAVVDTDSNKSNLLLLLDPLTGQAQPAPAAGCAAPVAGRKLAPRLEEVYFNPGSDLVYRMYGSFGFDQPACVDQLDLAAGKVNWKMSPADKQVWPSAWFATEELTSDQGVFFYEDNTLSLIEAGSGKLKVLLSEPRYREVTPLAAQQGLLVALAVPDYDSNLKELWGVDPATGKKLWVFKMQAKSITDPWRVRLLPGGVMVVQCLRDEKISQWEVLDPLTVASQGIHPLSDQQYYFLEDTWTPTTAYLKIDNTLYVLDLASGIVQYTWP